MREIEKLKSTISDIDCFADRGFAEISTLAKVAIKYLDSPEAFQHPHNIANLFGTIWGIADSVRDCIISEAEGVGCHDPDGSRDRIAQAKRVAFERWGGHHGLLSPADSQSQRSQSDRQ